MSLVSLSSPVSLCLWYFLHGIHSTKGSSVICEPLTCSSHKFGYEYCELDWDVTVVNASVTEIISSTKCINTKDYRSDDYKNVGFYGYDGNMFWVDKGCSAKFKICYMEGASVDCGSLTCSSEEYKLQKCVVGEDEDEEVKIITVSLVKVLSTAICVNTQDYMSNDNAEIGFYGYHKNIFWVYKGCSADFKICYTDTSSFTYSSSMISSTPTFFSEMFTTENDTDPMSTSAAETTRETSTSITEFYGTHSQTQKQHLQDSSDTTVVITVVAVVAGVLVLGIIGIILCRIRYKRNMTRRKESETVSDNKTATIPHTVDDFINERNYKTQQAKTASKESADTQGQLNVYNPISNGDSALRKKTNKNLESEENKPLRPTKRHVAEDNPRNDLVTKSNKECIKSSKNNPVGVNEVREEQTEQSEDYLEPVSNRSSLEESDNYIDLQPEPHIYDYIDPNYIPDTLS